MPGERKSVEPMAPLVAPARVSAEHQSLLHFVGQSPWSDGRALCLDCHAYVRADKLSLAPDVSGFVAK